MIQVDQELCAGCGVCMEACSMDAIRLINDHAVIDHALCTQCQACVDACPNGAITAIAEPARQAQIVALPKPVPAPITGIPVERETPTRSIAPAAGAVLAFLGSEVVPRLVDVLVTALERRLTVPTTGTTSSIPTSPRRFARSNRGIRRQARYRGRRNDIWKS
jgi:NAD-dependent dihydropyrimidine dehydrogenase PreA subunit